MKNIAETAYLVAMYRALESERVDALFKDPLARVLAGGKGEMLVEVIGEKDKITNAIAIRTYVLDNLILQLINSKNIDTVINLAAGLDTRPYRLPFCASLCWIEVDLPEIIAYKEQLLKDQQPLCLLERVKLDITNLALRKTFFSEINLATRQALVITEGLLSYLHETQVALLATDIYEQSNLNWWLFELESSLALKDYDQVYARKIFDQYFANGNKTLLFAPEQGAEFFQQYNWKVAKSVSAWKELHRLNRGIKFTWLLEIIMKLVANEYWEKIQQQGSVVLLERSPAVGDLVKTKEVFEKR
ncbi:SAM-dependent methyltransferase [Nostoc sp. NMS4]|uniref:class I SAM-dependent methyltransferase n=1 Tax=Nostoc sp. NMS4 TaxID=2815390 RepID=UPI0025FE128F|nr:SAM-dependent methyltransferase [Nostoc sp. NMS4]MBN3923748.1 class I SAM-dependent methyltransferase [Nostoc sp. NMS4]